MRHRYSSRVADRLHPVVGAGVAARGLLAAAVAISVGGVSSHARAQTAPQASASNGEAATRDYQIPAGSLSTTLTRYAVEAGVLLSVDAAMTAGRTSPGLVGRHAVLDGFRLLLAGTGLEAVASANGYTLRPAPPAADDSGTVLPAVKVSADAELARTALPEPYADTRIARGASIGVLGARDLLETPASIKSYTAEAIRDQIAFTSNDIAARDASFTITNAATLNNSTAGRLRGFRIEPFESTYDGFTTVADRRYPLEMLERVEILKGPTSIYTGVVGGVGGTLNYVSKKPLETPLTRVTGLYASSGQGGAQLDVSRRFGADQAYGLRVNLSQRDGETAIDDLSERSTVGHVAFNWRNERINVDAQYGFLEARTQGGAGGYFYGADVPIGAAPDGDKVSGPDWDDRRARSEFLRAVVDVQIIEGLSAFAVFGANASYERFVGLLPSVLDAAGNADSFLFTQEGEQDWGDSYNVDLGLRGRLQTGPVLHRMTLSFSQRRAKAAFSDLAIAPGYVQAPLKIYDPASYEGTSPTFTGGRFFPFSDNQTQGLVLADELSVLEDRLRLTAGLRYTNFDNDSFNFAADTAADEVRNYSADNWSPSAGLLYRWTPQLSVYGNYLRAVETAAVAPVQAVNAGQTIAPGIAEQFEIGAKLDLGKVGVTASLFEIDRPSTFIDPDTRVFGLFGRNRHRGLEFDVFGEPLPGVRTLLSYAFLDAQVRVSDDPALIGKVPVSVPDHVLVINLDADLPGLAGAAVTANLRYVDRQFYDRDNARSIPDFTILDLGARYPMSLGGYAVVGRANITNLLGKDYFQSTDFALQTGAPRTFLLSVEVNL